VFYFLGFIWLFLVFFFGLWSVFWVLVVFRWFGVSGWVCCVVVFWCGECFLALSCSGFDAVVVWVFWFFRSLWVFFFCVGFERFFVCCLGGFLWVIVLYFFVCGPSSLLAFWFWFIGVFFGSFLLIVCFFIVCWVCMSRGGVCVRWVFFVWCRLFLFFGVVFVVCLSCMFLFSIGLFLRFSLVFSVSRCFLFFV